MSLRVVNVMDEVCAECGLTWGAHCGDNRGPLCPGHEGRMDWDAGPGTTFKATGYHFEIEAGRAAFSTAQRQVLRDVRTLWPSLPVKERQEWAIRLKPWFSNRLFESVAALSVKESAE